MCIYDETFCECYFHISSVKPLYRLRFYINVFIYRYVYWYMGFPDSSVGKESVCSAGDPSLIPELGRSPGEGKSYPLQYPGLERFLDCKGNQSWMFIGRTDAEAPILWPPDAKSWLIWKGPDVGKLKAAGEGDDRGWDGWMASPTLWTWVWVSSGSRWWTGRPGVLQSMGSQRVAHDWVTELNWTDTDIWSRKWQPTAVSCLENSMDRGAWWTIIHELTKSVWTTEHAYWYIYIPPENCRRAIHSERGTFGFWPRL